VLRHSSWEPDQVEAKVFEAAFGPRGFITWFEVVSLDGDQAPGSLHSEVL
jgi:hypothetical protein